jgi:SAM-dependent methyltransferase
MHNTLGLGNLSSAFGDRGITKRLEAIGRRTPLQGDRLLDIGCGDGAYTTQLAAGFGAVDAVDVQDGPLAQFAGRIVDTPLATTITIRQMSATSLSFPDAAFDMVSAIEVLEHVTELDEALAEICRVLRPGGRFVFTTPNRWFPFETHGFLIGGRRYPPARAPFLTWVGPLHRRLADARTFTAAELRRRLAAAGLRVATVDYIMPPFDRSAAGRRLRPLTDFAEQTPLRVFGMALVVTTVKPG